MPSARAVITEWRVHFQAQWVSGRKERLGAVRRGEAYRRGETRASERLEGILLLTGKGGVRVSPQWLRGCLEGAPVGPRVGSSSRESEPSQAGGSQCLGEAGGVANAWSPG